MIDTKQFEVNVLISEHSKSDGVPQKVAFANHQGNVVKCYKYRTRKVSTKGDNQ